MPVVYLLGPARSTLGINSDGKKALNVGVGFVTLDVP
jgi:hypothetical protein